MLQPFFSAWKMFAWSPFQQYKHFFFTVQLKFYYFKFPASFRIKLPKVIGDYNPDWGLMRRDEKGKFVLQLIRETKFTTEAHLRFPHEKRKVACARQHFRRMNIDYRPIFPADFAEWWRSENEAATQESLDIGKVEKDQRQPQAQAEALEKMSKAAA
jgi:hypothetical protein